MLNSPIKNFSDSMKHYSTYQSQFIEMFDQVKNNKYGYKSYKLSECCSYISDGSHYSPKEDPNGQYPMLSVKDMTEKGFTYRDCKYINKEEYDKLVANGCKPEENDVLVAKDGSYFKYSFTILEEQEQAVLSSIAILRPNISIIDSKYLAYYLLTPEVIHIVEQNYLTGTAIKRVILKGFKELPILVPPLDKQQEFVSILHQADKSKFTSLKSQFIEMFSVMPTTPVKTYVDDSFPGEWGTEDTMEAGVKVIRTTNFTNSGKLNLADVVTRSIEDRKIARKQIKKYDTILERSGGTADNPVGRVVLFEEDDLFLCNNFTQVLRFKDIDPRFAFYSLYYFYQTNKTAIRSMGSKTTGIQNLNMSKYLEIGIPNASDEEQKEFVAIAEQADKSKYIN